MLHRSTTRVLLLLCVMYMITYMDRVNVSTGAIGFGKEFHLSNMQIGLVFSAFAYPYLIFQVIGGWVGDRFGPRRTGADCEPRNAWVTPPSFGWPPAADLRARRRRRCRGDSFPSGAQ